MERILEFLPQWALGIAAIMLSASLTYVLIRAFHEGRRISLWPPQIGPRNQEKSNGISHITRTVIRFDSDILGLLRGITGHVRGLIIFIERKPGKISFGRDNGQVDVYIPDRHISREHFVIRALPRQNKRKVGLEYDLQLIPLGAVMPPYLNNEPVTNVTDLKDGDLIQVGDSVFQLHLFTQPPEK